MSINLDDPRLEVMPSQPKHVPEMSSDEQFALFDATLDREEVAEMVWEAVIDEIGPAQAREIVKVLFRIDGPGTSACDFAEAGRLIHRACWDRVSRIVNDESSNTDMGRDD